MAVAFFNGVNLFGWLREMKTHRREAAVQVNAYAGLRGTEKIVLGGRGGTTVATGRLYGVTLAAFNAAEDLIHSYEDGNNYALVDHRGRFFELSQLVVYEPQGRLIQDLARGWFWQEYTITFDHQDL